MTVKLACQAVLALLISGSPLYCQTLTIKVHTTWAGLGGTKGKLTEVVISGEKGNYRTRGQRIDDKKVEAFLEALEEPHVAEPSIENCGITLDWLSRTYKSALESTSHRKLKEFSPQQIDLSRSRFTSLAIVQESFEKMFQSFHTDDYPEIMIDVFRNNDLEASTFSLSQFPFMLPWAGLGYNCHVSQALASILPKNTVNRDRLTLDEHFGTDLENYVMKDVQKEWDRLDTEWRVGPDIAPILARFDVVEMKLACLGSFDVDRCGWNAQLKTSSLPPAWTFGVTLYQDKKNHVRGVSDFLQEIDDYLALAVRVPWLSHYTMEHPELKIELRYVQDRSLSGSALDTIADGLREHGKAQIADRLVRDAESSVFLIADAPGEWSRWVVFPNRDMLLWDFRSESPLGFSLSELKAWDYYNWHASGTLVTPEGTLIRD